MDYGSGLAATGAIWMFGKEAFAGCFPLAVISALACTGPLLIECRLALTVTDNHVLAAFPGRQNTSAHPQRGCTQGHQYTRFLSGNFVTAIGEGGPLNVGVIS